MEGGIPLAIMAIVARVLNLIVVHSIRYYSRLTFGAKIALFIVEYASQLNSERALLA
jgi:hypothetical protein